jgi:hypothetical protein
VHLLDQVGWNLAGAEAGHRICGAIFWHFTFDPRGDIARGDGDGVGALQALVGGLDNLHDQKKAFWKICGRFIGWAGRTGAGEGTRTPTSCDTGT